jgi:PAS domain S-box-containing protein
MDDSLKRSEEIFRKAFLMSPDTININRFSDGLYIMVNEGFTKMTGFTWEDVAGKNFVEAGIWEDIKQRDLLTEELKQKGEVSNFEARFRMKDGTVREGLMSAVIIDIGGEDHILSVTRDITDKKQIEAALHESESRYQELIELAPDGILLGSPQGKIKVANSKIQKITGRTAADLLGSDIRMLFPPDEIKDNPFRFDLLGKGETVIRTRNILRSDGRIIPVEFHSKMMPDGSFQFICQDITARRNSENELRKLSGAVEQSPVSVLITDTNGTIEYVNQKLCEVSGYKKEELIGQNPSIWSTHTKSKEEFREFWETIKSGKDWKGEFQNRKKNGELYWESATISPIKNEKNQITHFLGIKEDITFRKKLEHNMIESERRYRELFLNNPIPSYIFDEDTLEFIEVNDAAVLSYGYTREEFSRMTLRDIRRPEDMPELMKVMREFGSTPFHSAKMIHKKKNGKTFPVDVTSHPLPEKNGRKTRLVMAADITESVRAAEQMKIAKEKAEASDRLKTTFLNNISHEVRTPLNGILGFVEIISHSDLSDQDREDSIAMLYESSDRLLNTITNYMDISLLLSGTITVNSKPLKPAHLLEQIYFLNEPVCLKRKIKLIMDIPENVKEVTIESDAEILRKILTQLVDNAVKFTEKGSVHFGYKLTGKRIEFFVRDTGIGIGRESLDKIFEKFMKEDRGPSRLTEGSGLGLSIAKGMIDLLNGSIKVDTEIGYGSVFSFSIPVSRNAEKEEQKIDIDKSSGSSAKGPILVAEDDENNFFYLNALLKYELDAKVIHASNGKEAVEMFKANPGIRLVLMDMKMPEVDGFEATRQIKQIKKDVPVIAVTAYAMSGDEERILAAGCDGYLSKPISKKSLRAKMAEFVK